MYRNWHRRLNILTNCLLFSKPQGYDTYAWPNGFFPGNTIPVCQSIPPDGRGVPEQVCVWVRKFCSRAFSLHLMISPKSLFSFGIVPRSRSKLRLAVVPPRRHQHLCRLPFPLNFCRPSQLHLPPRPPHQQWQVQPQRQHRVQALLRRLHQTVPHILAFVVGKSFVLTVCAVVSGAIVEQVMHTVGPAAKAAIVLAIRRRRVRPQLPLFSYLR